MCWPGGDRVGVRGVSAVPYMPANEAKGPYTVETLGATVKVDSSLKGAHQQRNVALAIAAAVELAEQHGISREPAAIRRRNSQDRMAGTPGADDKRGRGVVLDVAHNPAGAWALRRGTARAFWKNGSRGFYL